MKSNTDPQHAPTRRRVLISAGAAAFAGCGPGTAATGPSPRPRPLAPDEPTGSTASTAATGSTADTGDTEGLDPWPGVPGPEPEAPWNAPGTLDAITFACGVQTGDAAATSILVSVRTPDESVLSMILARGVDDGWVEVLSVADLILQDGLVQLELTDLVPDTTYSVAFYAPDEIRRTPAARFRTALYPDATRVVRLGVTSCLGTFGAPWPTLSRAAEEKLDVFLLLGDTIYADEGLRPAGDWDGHWSDALATEGLRDLCASTSFVATWDDHEVDNDWSIDDPGMPEDALTALAAFRRGIPQAAHGVGSGIWRRLSWGATLDLFVLDCRGERDGTNYISREQLDWLEAELSASQARFKLILNSVPITDMDSVYLGIAADDRWDGHPAQRTEILDYITIQGITGVLWLSGDFHWGALSTVGRDVADPGADQREVFAGPGGSLINPLGLLAQSDPQYDIAVFQHNYVRLEADPDAGTIEVAFIDGNGGIIASHTVVL